MYELPSTGYLRQWQILGRDEVTDEQAATNRERNREPSPNGKRRTYPCRPRSEITPLIPIKKSAWWKGIKEGRYPAPVKFGRATLWKVEDIRALIEKGVG